jgi:hypothetical protein
VLTTGLQVHVESCDGDHVLDGYEEAAIDCRAEGAEKHPMVMILTQLSGIRKR